MDQGATGGGLPADASLETVQAAITSASLNCINSNWDAASQQSGRAVASDALDWFELNPDDKQDPAYADLLALAKTLGADLRATSTEPASPQ